MMMKIILMVSVLVEKFSKDKRTMALINKAKLFFTAIIIKN